MHIKTPLTKERIRNHFHYSSWKYAVMVALAIFGWNLIYTMTAYRAPQDKRIDLYVLTYSSTSEAIDAFIKPIWEAVVPEMEEVRGIAVVPDAQYGDQQIATYLMAGDVDIFFLTESYFKIYASNGWLLPLEALVADGTIRAGDIDLTKGYVTVVEEAEVPETGETLSATVQHLYGIPLDTFYGFMEGMNIDNRILYAVIPVNNRNDANVIPFFDGLLQAGRGEMPEWLLQPQE